MEDSKDVRAKNEQRIFEAFYNHFYGAVEGPGDATMQENTEDNEPHLCVPTLDGNAHVIPVEVLIKIVSGEMKITDLEDWEIITRSIFSGWLKGLKTAATDVQTLEQLAAEQGMESKQDYYYLQKGDTIHPGDEVEVSAGFNDPPKWEAVKDGFGLEAPDPQYPAHSQYRRTWKLQAEKLRKNVIMLVEKYVENNKRIEDLEAEAERRQKIINRFCYRERWLFREWAEPGCHIDLLWSLHTNNTVIEDGTIESEVE